MDFDIQIKNEAIQEEIEYDLYIKEWEPRYMVLQCNFTDPTVVSYGYEFDVARINVRNRFLFTSAESGQTLKEEYASDINDFPRQVLPGIDSFALQAETQKAGFAVVAVAIVIMLCHLCLGGSLNDAWTLYYTMQMMCYLEIYDVSLPANAHLYLAEFTKIIELDFVFDLLGPSQVSNEYMVDDLFVWLFGLGVLVGLCVLISVMNYCDGCLSDKLKIK